MKGTWQTDDHGAGGGGLVLAAVLALLLIGSGAVAAIASAIIIAAAVLGGLVVLGGVTTVAYLAYRSRRERPAVTYHTGNVQQDRQQLADYAPPTRLDTPQRPALEQGAPRELHQHWHLHIGADADAGQVAAIMRQIREER